MKKLTSILCLLLLFLGVSTAWAGSQTIPELSTEGSYHYYAIKNVRKSKFILWNGDTNNLSESSTNTICGVFYFTAGSATSSTDGVTVAKIHNLSGQALAGFSSWNSTGIDWYIKANSSGGNTGISIASDANFSNAWNDYGGWGTYIGSYTANDAGSISEVVELTEDDVLALDKTLPSSLSDKLDVPFSSHTQAAYTTMTTAISSATTVDGLKSALSTYYASPMAELGEGSFLLLNKLHNRYVCATTKNGNSYLGCSTSATSFANVFTFKKQSDGKYKIYNEYFDKYVGYVLASGNRNSEFSLTDEANARTFTIAEASTSGYATFLDETITDKIDGITCGAWHVSANNANGGYGVIRWTTTADASMFKFVSCESLKNSLFTALTTKVNGMALGTTIGTYNTTDNTFSTIKTNFASSQTITNYRLLEEAIPTVANTPDASKYYTFKNVKTNTYYLTEDYANSNQLGLTKGTNIVPSLWKFEPCTTSGKTDLYYIQAANSKNYMSKTGYFSTAFYTMNVVEKTNANVGLYDLFNRDYIVDDAATTLTFWKDDARSDRGTATVVDGATTLSSWNGANEGRNNWIIEEVDEIPVRIGQTGYATLHLPMAVTIPTGVEAYYGASEGTNTIKLTALSGVIPAETPVILVASQGDYTFPIAYDDATAKPETNVLSGTLVPSTIADNATAYVLANGSQGIGMYKVTSTTSRTIAANKTYAGSLTAETSGAAQFVFNFDNVTGINAATTSAAQSNELYDLNGRRVLYPAHGVFVKANGQKVFIK